MNEKDTKELLEKSIIETSDDFTDKLMQRLEAAEVAEKTSVWRFTPIFSVLIVVILTLSFAFYKYLESGATLFQTGIEISRTPIFLIVTVLLLFAINHILKLNETYSIARLGK